MKFAAIAALTVLATVSMAQAADVAVFDPSKMSDT